MSSFPFLTVLIVVPAIGAAVVAAMPNAKSAKQVALGVSLVELLIGIVALTQFSLHSATQFQLEEKHSWIPQFGVSYSVGVDGIALSS